MTPVRRPPWRAQELSRAVHMALYAWQPGAILTSDCDDDINKYCLAARPNMQSRPGAVGACLASIVSGLQLAAPVPSSTLSPPASPRP